MIQRLLSLCRRLIGGNTEQPSAGKSNSGEDRRVWVRYPCVSRTRVQPSANGSDTLLSARVRNVSRGGVSLIVNHAFKAGEMISLDVPGNTSEEMSAVLACVVHAVPLPNGYWSLGCAFSEMLDEDDLKAFVTRKERTAPGEKRGAPRHEASVKANYQLVNDPQNKSWAAGVVNISPGGIGLQVDEQIENGSLLNLKLESHAGQVKTILACVVHVLSHGNKGRVLGCNFIHEMSEADFQALV